MFITASRQKLKQSVSHSLHISDSADTCSCADYTCLHVSPDSLRLHLNLKSQSLTGKLKLQNVNHSCCEHAKLSISIKLLLKFTTAWLWSTVKRKGKYRRLGYLVVSSTQVCVFKKQQKSQMLFLHIHLGRIMKQFVSWCVVRGA